MLSNINPVLRYNLQQTLIRDTNYKNKTTTKTTFDKINAGRSSLELSKDYEVINRTEGT